MIFEVAGIISAISSINQAVSLARDTQQTAATVGDMISNLTNAESRILRFEQKTKAKRPLTTAEAMKISLAKRDAQAIDRKLHDMCLSVNGGMELYRNAQKIKAKAQADHARFLKTVAKKRAARKQRIEEYVTAFAVIFAMLLVLGFAYAAYEYAYKPYQLKDAKERLQKARERQKNIRQCGRVKC